MNLKATWDGAFANLQKIGKALMLPVSVLPVAGILLGVGSSIAGADDLAPWLIKIGEIMAASGGAVFTILPLIFAIGVVLGFTKNDGVAAMAATVGYFVLIAALGVIGLMFIDWMAPAEPLGLKDGNSAYVEYDAARERFICLDAQGRTLSKVRLEEVASDGGEVAASAAATAMLPWWCRSRSKRWRKAAARWQCIRTAPATRCPSRSPRVAPRSRRSSASNPSTPASSAAS